jgi:hypothetical protein
MKPGNGKKTLRVVKPSLKAQPFSYSSFRTEEHSILSHGNLLRGDQAPTCGTEVSKVVPVTGLGGLYVYENLRITHCLYNMITDSGEVIRLRRRLRSTPKEHFLILISVGGGVNPKTIVRVEGVDSNPRPSGL